MRRLVIGVLICAAAVGCVLAYRHFVTRQVTDKGGMENPFLLDFPRDAALQSLDWNQTAMRYDDGFRFFLRQEEGAYYISGEYTQPSEGLRVRRENAPLTAEDWAAVEQCLKDSSHTPPQEADPDIIVTDQAESRLEVTWKTPEGETGSAAYAGGNEEELLRLLRDLLAGTPE